MMRNLKQKQLGEMSKPFGRTCLDSIPPGGMRVVGFTLMELMVVIAVIGVVASLLLPVLSRAKEKARAVQCFNHNRQLAMAWTMYVDDNRGELPPNRDSIDNEGVPVGWVAGHMGRPQEATNEAVLMNQERSLIASYVGSAELFKCPGDRSRNVRSYAMNCRMGPFRPEGPPSWVGGFGTNFATFHSSAEIRSPSKVLVILDERSDSINDGYFAIDMSNTGTPEGHGVPNPYYIIDYPASYHNGAGTVSFADGHAEVREWLEPTTRVPMGQAHARKHTSPNDQDMRWLQGHSTYLER